MNRSALQQLSPYEFFLRGTELLYSYRIWEIHVISFIPVDDNDFVLLSESFGSSSPEEHVISQRSRRFRSLERIEKPPKIGDGKFFHANKL